MRKILKVLLIAILLLVVVLSFTACGSDSGSSSNLISDLNKAISTITDEWREDGYGGTVTMTILQNTLDSLNMQYTIIASGDIEFTSAPDSTKYIVSVPDYEGYTIDNVSILLSNIKYCVVYENETGKYYNVQISYESDYIISSSVETDYPVFSNATEIK